MSAPGGSVPGGVSALGGFAWGCLLPGGLSAPGGGGIPACTEANTPLWTESQMPVKTLPWPNFVAASKYLKEYYTRSLHLAEQN